MKKFFLTLTFLILLCSCTGREPNDEAYISAIGIDKGSESGYSVTIQFALPSNISGGSSEEIGNKSNIVENINIDAPDIYSAVSMANHMISKKLSLSHMKLIVFSDEVAKNGIYDIMEMLAISDEVRPNLITAVSIGSANDYLENTKPIVELNPTKYYYLIYEKNNSSGIPSANAINVISDLESGGRDIVMPLAGVTNAQKDKKEKNEQDGFEFDMSDYKAGEVNIIEEKKSEALGMAVFSGDKLAAELGKTQTDIYSILTGEYENNYVSFYYPHNGKENITVRLSERRKPKYKIDIENEIVYIKIFMDGEYSSVPNSRTGKNYEFEAAVSEYISSACKNFITKMRDEYNADVLGISQKSKYRFWDMDDYDNYDFKKRFRNYDIAVDTELSMKTSGVLNQ